MCDHRHHSVKPAKGAVRSWIAILLLCTVATVMQYHHHDHDGGVCFLWSVCHEQAHCHHDASEHSGETPIPEDDDCCVLHSTPILATESNDNHLCCACGQQHNAASDCYFITPAILEADGAHCLSECMYAPEEPLGVIIKASHAISRRGPPHA